MAVVGEAAALQDGVVQDRRPGLISGVGLGRGFKREMLRLLIFLGFWGPQRAASMCKSVGAGFFRVNVLPHTATCYLDTQRAASKTTCHFKSNVLPQQVSLRCVSHSARTQTLRWNAKSRWNEFFFLCDAWGVCIILA